MSGLTNCMAGAWHSAWHIGCARRCMLNERTYQSRIAPKVSLKGKRSKKKCENFDNPNP